MKKIKSVVVKEIELKTAIEEKGGIYIIPPGNRSGNKHFVLLKDTENKLFILNTTTQPKNPWRKPWYVNSKGDMVYVDTGEIKVIYKDNFSVIKTVVIEDEDKFVGTVLQFSDIKNSNLRKINRYLNNEKLNIYIQKQQKKKN